MSERAVVVMSFFMVRVFLVGGIMLAFPRIARKGLVFGSYLGEAPAEEAARRRVMRVWDLGTALIMLVALIVGWSIGLSGRWVRGNFIGTAVLVLLFIPLYVRVHGEARKAAGPAAAAGGARSAASLAVDEARGQGFARFALAVTLLASVALVGYALVSFQAMPERIPSVANLWGHGDAFADRPLVSVLLIPAYNLVFAPFYAAMGLLITRSKRSIRAGSGGGSVEAQAAFRVATSHVFAGTGLATCLFLGVVSVGMIRIWQGKADALSGAVIGGVAVAIVLYLGASLFRIMWLGQGGARLERGSPDAPLTGALADNDHWVLGILYVNRADPATMVEARWGIGYTLNLGNRGARTFLTVFAASLLGLLLLTLVAGGVFP